MVVISASKMKLEPHEVIIDPILEGVAFVEKKIGDKTYEAFVESWSVRNNELQCFPDLNPAFMFHSLTRTIRVGSYSWVMSSEDFNSIEWVK